MRAFAVGSGVGKEMIDDKRKWNSDLFVADVKSMVPEREEEDGDDVAFKFNFLNATPAELQHFCDVDYLLRLRFSSITPVVLAACPDNPAM